MSEKPRRIDFNPDQFIAGVAGQLEPAEIGVYWVICSLIYSKGGPIPDDRKRLASLMGGCDLRVVNNAIRKLVELAKVEVSESQLVVKRCLTELQVTHNRMLSAQQNGSKGGRPPSKNNELEEPGGSRDEKLLPLPLPEPLPIKKESELRSDKKDAASKLLEVGTDVAVTGGNVTTFPTKGTRLSEDWQPDESDVAYAVNHGWPPARILQQSERFRNHWLSKSGVDARKTNWSRTWKNWVTSPHQSNRNGGSGEGGGSGGQGYFAQMSKLIAEAEIRVERRGDDPDLIPDF